MQKWLSEPHMINDNNKNFIFNPWMIYHEGVFVYSILTKRLYLNRKFSYTYLSHHDGKLFNTRKRMYLTKKYITPNIKTIIYKSELQEDLPGIKNENEKQIKSLNDIPDQSFYVIEPEYSFICWMISNCFSLKVKLNVKLYSKNIVINNNKIICNENDNPYAQKNEPNKLFTTDVSVSLFINQIVPKMYYDTKWKYTKMISMSNKITEIRWTAEIDLKKWNFELADILLTQNI